MRSLKVILSAVSLLLALPLAGRTAYAHGGQYRGPAGEVPPDSRQPEDPPPPETGGGTPTPPDPGGGTPTPPDPGGGTPTPPDGGGTPDPTGPGGGNVPQPPGPGSGTKTGKQAPKKQTGFDSWLFWWNYNKDEIINLKKQLRSGLAGSGSGLGLSGHVEGSENAAEAQNITAKAIEQRVVPILMDCARDSKLNFDIQASGVIGLAKVGRKDSIPLLMEIAKNAAGQYHKVVEETSCLSLGIMQERTPQIRQFLSEIASDTTAKYRSRCFALFALGLLGEQDATAGSYADTFRTLESIAANPTESSRDVTCSALVAIGLMGDRAVTPKLLQWLNEEKVGANKLPDLQLSFVAAAMGKIGQPGLGPDFREVVDALKDQLNKKNRMTRYSSVIALGQIAPQADEKVQKDCVTMLTQLIKSEGKATADTQTVNFALASLGRIAGAPSCPESVRRKAIDALGDEFVDGKKSQTKSFAALGLGIAGMNLPESEKAPIAEKISQVLSKQTAGDVESRGAFVIALGLLKDIRSAPLLQSLLADKGLDKQLRGTAAVALGLIGDSSAIEPIRKVLREKEDQKLRVDAAIAAGLLKDNQAVPVLVEILQDEKSSQFILGSVAQALGQIGDQRAVEPLALILKDEKGQYPDLTRALSAVALGQIGDKNDVPVLARLSRDVNYRAYYEAIGEVLTIL